MNDTKVNENKIVQYLKLIPHYYFLGCDYFLKGIETVVKLIFKYFVVVIQFVLKRIKASNNNKIVHAIYLPFILIYKGITYLPNRIIHYISGLSMEKKKGLTGYGFLTPWLFGLIMFVLIPVGLLTYNSFHLVKQDGQTYNRTFVGFENYQRILRVDIDFMVEVQDFVVRVLLFTPVIIALAVIVAMLLNQSIKGKAIFRLIFFLPVIILNGQLLSTMRDNGGMDIHLSRFVLDVITTIVPVFALDLFIDLFSIIIEILWYTGVPILIFLAMLQKIDRSLYEAASIDGANAWSIFWKITLPIIRPAISVSVIFIVVFLANFDGNPINALIVSSNGNPSRYQGYAAAMAILYSIIQVFVIGILLLITTPRNKGGRR